MGSTQKLVGIQAIINGCSSVRGRFHTHTFFACLVWAAVRTIAEQVKGPTTSMNIVIVMLTSEGRHHGLLPAAAAKEKDEMNVRLRSAEVTNMESEDTTTYSRINSDHEEGDDKNTDDEEATDEKPNKTESSRP